MAIAPSCNVITRHTTNVVAGKLTQVTIPLGCTIMLIRPVTADGKIADTGLDATAVGADYATISADAWHPWPVAGLTYVYIASAANSGILELVFPPVAS